MELFHVLNRGVDKRIIFLDDYDRLRFMQGLYVYNNKNLVNRNIRRHTGKNIPPSAREKLIDIHAFCLMDNHYHLLLSAQDDDTANIAAFMKKLNMGYAKYFNEKYKRVGALWQGKYKSILIEKDAYFQYIPYYIHLNPLDMKFPEWRTGNTQQITEALLFLKLYRWSSYLDYQNISNYPSIITTTLIKQLLGSTKNQEAEIKKIIRDESLVTGLTKLEYE